jgi:hypothetical protein
LLEPNVANQPMLMGGVHACPLDILGESEDEVGMLMHNCAFRCRSVFGPLIA